MSGLYRLKGQVKHYDWGGYDFIPALLNLENKNEQPYAEYWMGVHAQGPAELIGSNGQTSLLSEHAPHLPFLLKLLDVRDMLSIQVHPNKQMAEADYERENAAGIPLTAPNRNYKDPNHKPELMVAMGTFWLLHGFRSPDSLKQIFSRFTFLEPVRIQWEHQGYAGMYRWLMQLPQSEVNRLLAAPLHAVVDQYKAGRLSKEDPSFWAARAHLRFSTDANVDRGIFSIFLFNLVRLEKGQGIFQAAGVPHAYLEGQNVEIMANSDNVLRGGLTPKHIDVNELLRHIKPEPIVPNILDPAPDANGWRHFPVPVPDFELGVLACTTGQHPVFESGHSMILLMPDGKVDVRVGAEHILLGSPQLSAYIEKGLRVELDVKESGSLFMARGVKPD